MPVREMGDLQLVLSYRKPFMFSHPLSLTLLVHKSSNYRKKLCVFLFGGGGGGGARGGRCGFSFLIQLAQPGKCSNLNLWVLQYTVELELL